MKKIKLLFVALISISNLLLAQSQKEVFDKKTKITWLGLDFSSIKFIGDDERMKDTDLRKMIRAWNDLMLKEAPKYDIGKALHREMLPEAVQMTINHNEKVDLSHAIDAGAKLMHMNREDIAPIVASYDFGTLKGVGVMLIVESFSKTEKEASIWLTFVNMETKEVIFTYRLITKPEGFGLRNYWAGSVKGALRQINSKYSKWKNG